MQAPYLQGGDHGTSKKDHNPNWFTFEPLKSKQLLCSLDSSLSCSLFSGLVQTLNPIPLTTEAFYNDRAVFVVRLRSNMAGDLFFPLSLLF